MNFPSASLAMATGVAMLISGCRESAVTASAADSRERADERARMVSEQIVARGVSDPRVLDAMRRVPRHEFVPGHGATEAYLDTALPIGYDQTISQPYVVAFMTEALQLQGDEKVLEIGTGSGYQAAILGELAREVFTIEIIEPLARRAAILLGRLGYENVHVRCGDGYRGWPDEAPFDAIIVTAAPDHVPQPLIDQLVEGGRMIVPVGDEDQQLILLRRTPTGLERESVLPVRFVPMTGIAEQHD